MVLGRHVVRARARACRRCRVAVIEERKRNRDVNGRLHRAGTGTGDPRAPEVL